MKISQTQGVATNTTPQYAPPNYLSADIAVGLIAGGVGALGLPKLISMFASEKIEESKSERRRDDRVLESVLEVNRTMMAGQSSNNSEMLQLTATLVSEISLMREVILNNTSVMTDLKDVTESLALQSHENTTMISELSETVTRLKDEVSQLTCKT